MPVEFLTDSQAAAYASFDGAPSHGELDRFFFLDDGDRARVEDKRREHNRLGFAVQLTSVRFLEVFLDDSVAVPTAVVDYLADQLGIDDPSVLKAYGEREPTRREHVRELRQVLGLREFADAEAELRSWVDARAWTTGDGLKALFNASVAWLREHRVLLLGVTTLPRLIPTGTCWCGCGRQVGLGSFFAQGHDKVSEGALLAAHYTASARKHDIPDADIRHALDNYMRIYEDQGEVALFIGPAHDGTVLEIGVVLDDEDPRIIHAMHARAKYWP